MSGRWRHCGAGSRKGGQSRRRDLEQYVDILPEHLTRRFIDAEKDAVVVSGRVPDVDASQLLPVVEDSIKALDESAPNIPAIASRSPAYPRSRRATAPSMIEKLNRGLTIEFVSSPPSSASPSARSS